MGNALVAHPPPGNPSMVRGISSGSRIGNNPRVPRRGISNVGWFAYGCPVFTSEELVRLRDECELFRSIILDADLENRWHIHTHREEEVESAADFSARMDDLYTDLRSTTEDFVGISEEDVSRIIEVETEIRELICLYDVQSAHLLPNGMR